MIDLIFFHGTEILLVRVNGHDVRFSNSAYGNIWSSIEGLKLDYAGVCREFPDLESRTDWKQEAIKRFKEKLKSLGSEESITDYLISDLKKYGYIPKFKQKAGFRRETINE